jgi:hypothetical protein
MNSNFDLYKFQGGGMLPTQENLTFKGANIDFGDYISPDTRLIASNAAFAQQVANKRLGELMDERQKIIDAVQLDKRFAQLQGQLTGQLDSLVEQASKSQLSDNANFTKFNTGLIKVKTDPAIQTALNSTENAKVYADWRIKNPNAVDKDYLNGGNEKEFVRFKNGETDEFVMRPTYVEPKWREKIFEGIKNLPQQEKEVFKTQGSAIFQEKTKGLDEQRALNSANSIVNYLVASDPETAPHFKRMMQFGYDPLPDIQNTVKAAVDQYKNESVTLSAMTANPNKLTAYQQQSLGIQNYNAETSRMNALNRGSDGGESGGKGLQIVSLTGAPVSAHKIDIKNGNNSFRDEYIAEIAALKGIPEEDILLQSADLTTGNITYTIPQKDASGMATNNRVLATPINFPSLVKQNQQPPAKPPAKPTVKAAPKGNVDKNNPYLKK